MAGYLFVHFTGEKEDGEQIYFSVSEDGLHWTDLNSGRPVLVSRIGEKGVRDPFVVKNEKSGRYYLIATDLRIASGKGWEVAQYRGSRDLIVWESDDLIHWSEERCCTVGAEGVGCVWAPESVYVRERGEFFVFWASMVKLEGDPQPKQRIYGAYTADFRTFTEPFVYMEAPNHLIDMTIVEEGGIYYRFTKDETTKKIRMDCADSLTGQFENMKGGELDGLFGVEGPECYQLPDGRWCLIVDRFAAGKGYLPLVCSSLEKGDFKTAPEGSYDMGVSMKRHGGVLKITDTELEALRGI